MKLEKIMKKSELVLQGFKEAITGQVPILYRAGMYQTIIYFKYKRDLYKKAREIGRK
jgi:hypothetical protein